MLHLLLFLNPHLLHRSLVVELIPMLQVCHTIPTNVDPSLPSSQNKVISTSTLHPRKLLYETRYPQDSLNTLLPSTQLKIISTNTLPPPPTHVQRLLLSPQVPCPLLPPHL